MLLLGNRACGFAGGLVLGVDLINFKYYRLKDFDWPR